MEMKVLFIIKIYNCMQQFQNTLKQPEGPIYSSLIQTSPNHQIHYYQSITYFKCDRNLFRKRILYASDIAFQFLYVLPIG